jgi:hypothetical protein
MSVNRFIAGMESSLNRAGTAKAQKDPRARFEYRITQVLRFELQDSFQLEYVWYVQYALQTASGRGVLV